MPSDEVARRRAVVCLSGTVGQAFAAGIEYQWLSRDDAVVLAASWRADQHHEATTPPDPTALQPHAWDVPNEADPEAVSAWIHVGRGGDAALALDFIETVIATIPDIAERNCARGIEWTNAQSAAVRLVRENIATIRDLAKLLCENGGALSVAEVEAFFDAGTPRAGT